VYPFQFMGQHMIAELDCKTTHSKEQREAERAAEEAASRRRLADVGVDMFIPRRDVFIALDLSAPTTHRMQKRGELPPFEEISPGRKGWRLSVLKQIIAGRRDWREAA
jgi:predicted DNA-binding transcriptional regulator AlpA